MANPTSKLLDIVLPPPPALAENNTLILISTIVLFLIVAIILYGAFRSGFKYKIHILILKKELTSSNIEPRAAAYKLASILKAAHNTTRLSAFSKGIAKSRQPEWSVFVSKLSDYRYADTSIRKGDVLSLLNEAMSWTARTQA